MKKVPCYIMWSLYNGKISISWNNKTTQVDKTTRVDYQINIIVYADSQIIPMNMHFLFWVTDKKKNYNEFIERWYFNFFYNTWPKFFLSITKFIAKVIGQQYEWITTSTWCMYAWIVLARKQCISSHTHITEFWMQSWRNR